MILSRLILLTLFSLPTQLIADPEWKKLVTYSISRNATFRLN